ncbi:MAG: accessory gene regulator B family protein [Epulopiscium sp.]|nr:accessory gene regulator B family protein [Candidatus Epulonipiscium sp.]
MIDRLAAGISYQINKKQLFSHTQIRQIQYGLQALISETVKIFFICILLYLTGTLKYGLFAMIVFSSLRIWAGGYHANTYFRCFIISLSIIYFSVLGGLYIQRDILVFIQAIFSLGIILKFAPAEHKNQPIISRERRKKIHTIALGTFIFWLCILFKISGPWKYIGMNAIFIETLTIIYMVFSEKNLKDQ